LTFDEKPAGVQIGEEPDPVPEQREHRRRGDHEPGGLEPTVPPDGRTVLDLLERRVSRDPPVLHGVRDIDPDEEEDGHGHGGQHRVVLLLRGRLVGVRARGQVRAEDEVDQRHGDHGEHQPDQGDPAHVLAIGPVCPDGGNVCCCHHATTFMKPFM
jgi:hypothetical protein